MRMKPSSPGRKPVSRAKAKNATLLNLLATPGLGSLIARRWIAGTGQILLACIGCAMMLVWFYREMGTYYGLMFSGVEPRLPDLKLLRCGVILFAASWLWSAVTSLSLWREASAGSIDT